MQRIYLTVILVCFLFSTGCALKLPFISDRAKEKKVELKSVERVPKYCYVRKNEDPCVVCENVTCQGGRE